MKRARLFILLLMTAAMGLCLGIPGKAGAQGYYTYRYHHRVVRRYTHPYMYHRYYRTSTPYMGRVYGNAPNIRYFSRNGHMYARNLDTGNVYIVRW